MVYHRFVDRSIAAARELATLVTRGVARVVKHWDSGHGLLWMLLVLFALASCRAGDLLRPPPAADSTTEPEVPTDPVPGRRLIALSGDGQTDSVGSTLALPFVVRIEDDAGVPVSGAAVDWTLISGGGSITASASVTDAAGESRAVLTLGSSPGSTVVEASAPTAADAPTRFEALAVPGAPSEIGIEVDASDTTIDEPISPALRIVLTDRFGNLTEAADGSATVDLLEGTGTPLASAYGTLTAALENGRATFDNVRVDLPGTGYRLRVTWRELSVVTSAFDVSLLSAPGTEP